VPVNINTRHVPPGRSLSPQWLGFMSGASQMEAWEPLSKKDQWRVRAILRVIDRLELQHFDADDRATRAALQVKILEYIQQAISICLHGGQGQCRRNCRQGR
jgi:hypothetical protein